MKTPTKVLNQESRENDVLISELANYNLPYFVLEMVARECDSELARKGKITTILASMNDVALTLLHRIFVLCENDEAGNFSNYRFAVFVSSTVHSRPRFDQTLTGRSGVQYRVNVAVSGDQGLLAVGQNKSKGEKVSIDELLLFNKMVTDISKSNDGKNLLYAFYGSSVGYEKGFSKVFAGNKRTRTPANKYGHSIPKTIILLESKDKNTNKVFSASF